VRRKNRPAPDVSAAFVPEITDSNAKMPTVKGQHIF
jgi:hypothetical protein